MLHGDMKILVVDDVGYIRMQIKKILRDNGFLTVKEAADGVHAIEVFKELNPDIILLDLTLPKISGLDLIKIFLQLNKNIKILVVSSNENEKIHREVIQRGALDFLLKPVKSDLLIKKIDKLIENKLEMSVENINDIIKLKHDYSEKIAMKLDSNKLIQVLNIYGSFKNEDCEDLKKTISSLQIYHYKNIILNLNGVIKFNIDYNKIIELKDIVEGNNGKFIIVLLKEDIKKQLDNSGLEDYIVKTESQALDKI